MITDHHVFPPPPGAERIASGGAEAFSNGTANLTIQTQTPPLEGAGFQVGYWPLLLFLLLLVAVSLLLISSRSEQAPAARERPGLGGPMVEPAYSYQGLRAALRRAFLDVRRAAETVYNRSLRHLAPGELASLIGGPASSFVRGYWRAMYSSSPPEPEEAERLVGEAGRVVEWVSRGREGSQ